MDNNCCDHCQHNPEDQCPLHYKVVKAAWAKLKAFFGIEDKPKQEAA